MIIACASCQKSLTVDLLYTPAKYDRQGFLKNLFFDAGGGNSGIAYDEDSNFFPEWKFKTGMFAVIKARHSPKGHLKNKRYIAVSEKSILPGVIPEFIKGYGCCNWSLGEKLKCSCGNQLGNMNLDCYEEGVIKFRPDSVLRVYPS